MGQYYVLANLDKKEFIHPHRFDEGLKFLELTWNPGVKTALLYLIRQTTEDGAGGDICASPDPIGRWAGDRIALVGDYDGDGSLFGQICDTFKDISHRIILAMKTVDPEYAKEIGLQFVPD